MSTAVLGEPDRGHPLLRIDRPAHRAPRFMIETVTPHALRMTLVSSVTKCGAPIPSAERTACSCTPHRTALPHRVHRIVRRR
ncbi:hypothetical protein AB0B69_32510, partial [Micromonospora parva]|uniref:hypothetical protein n=1 Tax=Micromonospora parva TaxID=1464048 RepID=UPI0033E0A009